MRCLPTLHATPCNALPRASFTPRRPTVCHETEINVIDSDISFPSGQTICPNALEVPRTPKIASDINNKQDASFSVFCKLSAANRTKSKLANFRLHIPISRLEPQKDETSRHLIIHSFIHIQSTLCQGSKPFTIKKKEETSAAAESKPTVPQIFELSVRLHSFTNE